MDKLSGGITTSTKFSHAESGLPQTHCQLAGAVCNTAP